jgi:hypothetical protein
MPWTFLVSQPPVINGTAHVLYMIWYQYGQITKEGNEINEKNQIQFIFKPSAIPQKAT